MFGCALALTLLVAGSAGAAERKNPKVPAARENLIRVSPR